MFTLRFISMCVRLLGYVNGFFYLIEYENIMYRYKSKIFMNHVSIQNVIKKRTIRCNVVVMSNKFNNMKCFFVCSIKWFVSLALDHEMKEIVHQTNDYRKILDNIRQYDDTSNIYQN